MKDGIILYLPLMPIFNKQILNVNTSLVSNSLMKTFLVVKCVQML